MSDPIASQVDPKLATALAAFGPWGAIAGLALTFGLPFVDQLIANAKNNTVPTPEEWANLRAKIATPFVNV